MAVKFDEEYWSKIIQHPGWYFQYVDFAKQATEKLGKDSQELTDLIKNIRYFFEDALLNDKVALASSGPNLDAERLPIDTVVMHHTSSKPGYRVSYMNAVQLLNIYASHYANPSVREERSLKDKPVWSGHFINGKPSFIGYHWLVRMDGTFERLLQDDQLGWHAANWEINKRSVGYCFDNDYENRDPEEEILKATAKHIKANYPQVTLHNVVGHKEVSKNDTVCPGGNFTDGWKPKLQEFMV